MREADGLDALVNNASILGPRDCGCSTTRLMRSSFMELYHVNTIVPLTLVPAVWDELKPGGRIINITSDAGVVPYTGWGGYGPSKAALEHLSTILAAKNPSLRVYGIDPGDVRTQIHRETFPARTL